MEKKKKTAHCPPLKPTTNEKKKSAPAFWQEQN